MYADLPPRTPEQERQYQVYLVHKEKQDKIDALRNAAPDLLEALLDAKYALYGNGPANPKMLAAISKAQGERK